MLRDHLRSFWLGVRSNKLVTLINVGGLALGLAVFIALTFYVHREFSWDDHWQNADGIYRVVGTLDTADGGAPSIWPFAPWPVGTALQTRNQDAFAAYVRIYPDQTTLLLDGEEFVSQTVSYTEPDLLKLIQLETLEGSLQDVFTDPRALAIDVDVVGKLFGGKSPLGKTVTLRTSEGRSTDYIVKSIYRVPQPTTFELPFLAMLDATALPASNAGIDLWDFQLIPGSNPPMPRAPIYAFHYFMLNESFLPEPIAADLTAFVSQNGYMNGFGSSMRFTFQPLQEMHLGARLDHQYNAQRLWVYEMIGILVLLISGCNFVMLATLRSVDRMRETGIRKSLGGEAGELLRSYLVDAVLLTLLAACVALSLLELGTPALQRLLPEIPDFTPGWRGFVACFGIVLSFALLSGVYPAWLMSRGKPASLLRSGSLAGGGGSHLRRLLVGIQFSVVIGLLLGSAVMRQQINYMQQRDRGFSVDNIIGLTFRSTESQAKAPTLVEEFERLPGVEGAVVSISPGSITSAGPIVYRFTAPNGSVTETRLEPASVGAGYFDVMSVQLLAGREFSVELDGGRQPARDPAVPPAEIKVVLNASAVLALGFPNPEAAVDNLMEREMRNSDGTIKRQNIRVIGVVADMQFVSLFLPPVPQAYSFFTTNSFIAVKVRAGADFPAVRAAVEERWHAVLGDDPFMPRIGVDIISNKLPREEFETGIVIGSTTLAVIIALLGLYGLAASSVIKRIKEIGVRKVMGAGTLRIVGLLLWQFSKPVALANLVALPLGFWAITRWLERFPFRLDTMDVLWAGVGASAMGLGIAWLTVAFIAARAARQKPVQALRYE